MPDKSTFYYAAIVAWAVVVFWRVYVHDKYEKEPWWMLVAAVVAGFVVMMGLERIELLVLSALGVESGFTWKLALSAALVEDLARAALIVGLALAGHHYVNDPLDGMIYGMLIGLGMAAAESFDHLRAQRPADFELVSGELFRFVGHCFLGGVVGFAILEATPQTRPRIRVSRVLCCFAAAALPHFVIDYAAESHGQQLFARWGIAAGFTMAFVMWWTMLVVAGRRSHALFAAPARAFDVIPAEPTANSPAPPP
jgi:RsiW-degrading membrane proteinase PrsW (M82 family)